MEQDKIWDHFQNDPASAESAFNARPRYAAISRRIETNWTVLNIGVGRGGLERALSSKGVRVCCLDPNTEAVARVRTELGLGDDAKVGYSQAIPFEDLRFDAVVMSEVLEHLASDVLAATLTEVQRVLKRGGRFLGSVPADEPILDSLVVCPHCGLKFHRWGHIRSFTHAQLDALLGAHFCDVVVSRHYFSDWDNLNWKGQLVWIVKQAARRVGLNGRDETFLFQAIKR